MSTEISPLAPKSYPKLPEIRGVKLATHAAGIRYKGRDDLMIVELAPGTVVAGVFTKSSTAAAPVLWCKEALKRRRPRFVVVNSGNANAFNGVAGVESVKRTVDKVAELLPCIPEEVFVASTGTIGEPLDDSKITGALKDAIAKLAPGNWEQAARAILTTDTYPKVVTRSCKIGDVDVTINGFCKGAGMIAPDMATMLAFIFTDAKVPAPILQEILEKGVNRSFNCITVDSDTSTSDTLLCFATGQAGGGYPAYSAQDPKLREFRKTMDGLLMEMAHQVVRDGEGATKFVQIAVTGATSAASARTIGMAIANSPLVKTAIAGEDANWGRIVMAVGKSGEKADRDKLSITIGGTSVAANGQRTPGYDETPVAKHMKGDTIDIAVDVGVGRGKATVWTCDLTHGYIDINGSYRT